MAIESKMARGPIGARTPVEERKSKIWFWIAIIFIMVVLAGVWYYKTVGRDGSTVVTSDAYQAVFLDNGQVYFGKLDRSHEEFYVLTDVFYLQSGVAVTETANLALTKLGAEAHGPEDRMEINVDHVLFVEDMQGDSKVTQAIQQYKNK
jgi:hypothetical protein